jgi:probable F420-dependent oxidoreductase
VIRELSRPAPQTIKGDNVEFGVMMAYERIADPGFLRGVAQAAEDLGFASIWMTEHVVYPTGKPSRPSPYVSDEAHPRGGATPRFDPLAALAYIAAATERISLATSVVVLPLRAPAILAKEVATIDVLSGGRMMLGVGVGWLAEEFDAVGVPFGERGQRTDEYIDALRAIWAMDNIEFRGRFVAVDGVQQYPKPTRGSVPIVVGGMSDAAARRAGERGDAFFPLFKEGAGLPELFDRARAAARVAGRDPGQLRCFAALPRDRRELDTLEQSGAQHIVVPSLGGRLSADEVIGGLTKIAAELGPRMSRS